jgi:hypothetical protein
MCCCIECYEVFVVLLIKTESILGLNLDNTEDGGIKLFRNMCNKLSINTAHIPEDLYLYCFLLREPKNLIPCHWCCPHFNPLSRRSYPMVVKRDSSVGLSCAGIAVSNPTGGMDICCEYCLLPILVAELSKPRVCGCWLAGSKPVERMDVCVVCVTQ